MKIFIICCLLFIHVNMCIFIRRFRVSIRVSGIRSGFGYPRVWFWWWISTRIGFRFGFEFQFWVHGDSTRSEPDPLPSLIKHKRSWYKKNVQNYTYYKVTSRSGQQYAHRFGRQYIYVLMYHERTSSTYLPSAFFWPSPWHPQMISAQ
jgi:hypothetical protein